MRDPAYIAAWSASLAEHVRAAETLATVGASKPTTAAARTPPGSTPSSGVDIMRSSAPALAALRTLPQSALLLLLTPVLPPPNPKPSLPSASKPAADPFEPLGRHLSTHHPRIRHVPYLPTSGLSTIHRGFLQEANAVIVVVHFSDDTADSPRQPAIAREIASLAKGPAILIIFGDSEDVDDERVLDAYATVIRAGQLDTQTFETIARRLFEARE